MCKIDLFPRRWKTKSWPSPNNIPEWFRNLLSFGVCSWEFNLLSVLANSCVGFSFFSDFPLLLLSGGHLHLVLTMRSFMAQIILYHCLTFAQTLYAVTIFLVIFREIRYYLHLFIYFLFPFLFFLFEICLMQLSIAIMLASWPQNRRRFCFFRGFPEENSRIRFWISKGWPTFLWQNKYRNDHF